MPLLSKECDECTSFITIPNHSFHTQNHARLYTPYKINKVSFMYLYSRYLTEKRCKKTMKDLNELLELLLEKWDLLFQENRHLKGKLEDLMQLCRSIPLAELMINKQVDHLPFFHQIQMMQQMGAQIIISPRTAGEAWRRGVCASPSAYLTLDISVYNLIILWGCNDEDKKRVWCCISERLAHLGCKLPLFMTVFD